MAEGAPASCRNRGPRGRVRGCAGGYRLTGWGRSRVGQTRGGTCSARCACVLTCTATAMSSLPGARERTSCIALRDKPPSRCETASIRDGLFPCSLASSVAARCAGGREGKGPPTGWDRGLGAQAILARRVRALGCVPRCEVVFPRVSSRARARSFPLLRERGCVGVDAVPGEAHRATASALPRAPASCRRLEGNDR